MGHRSFRTPLAWGVAVVLLAVPASFARAQGLGPAVITGRVTTEAGAPATGAVVSVVELNIGVSVNPEGRYSITVPGERVRGQAVTVTARAIGYRVQSTSLTLNAGTFEVNFALAQDVFKLEAVVVTGVSAETRLANVPFSVDRLDVTDLKVPAVNALTQLQGKVPGANIVGHSGRPGAAPAVILRGPKSMNSQGRSQEPLYIVDGVIVRGGLPDINPQDIESVEVIKGAAASSLYGAQAGNGVIQISTKSGRSRSEGFQIGYRSEAGGSDIERDFGIARRHALVMDETGTRFCEFVSGQPLCARTFDYRQTVEAINNAPTLNLPAAPSLPVDPGATSPGAAVLKTRFQIDPYPFSTWNAVNQAVRPNPFQTHSVDVTGRVGGTSIFASASYVDQPGAIRFLEGYDRVSLRLNADQELGSMFQLGVRTYYSHSEEDGENFEGGSGNAFFYLTRAPAAANLLARDTLGRLHVRTNLQTGGLQNYNPLHQLATADQKEFVDRFLGGAELRFAPLPWLQASANLNFDVRRHSADFFRDKGWRDTFNRPSVQGGFLEQWVNNNDALNASLNVSTEHQFGDLRIRPTARYYYEQQNTKFRDLGGSVLAVQGIKNAANVTSGQFVSSSVTETKQISYAAGVNLEYRDGVYILDGSIRRDGSSRFGARNRWDTYGRVSAAWRLAREPWWPIPDVSEFKLRASYGTAGQVPNFAAQYETFTIGAGGVVSFATLGNSELRPEKMREVEVGADLDIASRMLLEVTYANTRVKDQILPVQVPATTGFGTQWQNVGTLTNKTWELSLEVPIIRQPDLSWSVRAIYDRTRTYVTELLVPPFNWGAPVQAGGDMFRMQEGERYGTIYGRKFLTSCSELPNWTVDFRAQCGPGKAFQVNSDGLVVWVGQGNSLGDGIKKNLWQTSLPGSQAPYGDILHWGMPIVMRDTVGGPASIVPLGNALPDFRMAFSTDVQWKRFTLYGLLDMAIGQDVWNQGFHWAHLDFLSKDVDQTGKSVEDAKPIGYYYRAGPPFSSGVGGLYDILTPTSFMVEDASYAKLREVLVSYRIGAINGVGDWSVSVVGRNLLTITGYRGFDPEVGIRGGQSNSAAINAIDAFTFPNLRTFTFGVSSTF
ncbi:MAG TPA: SusC/RagA family TonB-linked outer membrane protein [Gemmatimonadales bacterium]|nr:SusC/RagA family TonB-linked outer membrane protein [Gemmatimonadales bacterium]